ncbi:MAG: hypothetical protein K2L82_03010 [Lachnospiraceae bacterium]|nr:hypothetical protein [Lachnospiraceae bacterium]
MTEQDKMVFCTLFDSNYLDKGLALYHSMRKNIAVFKLYIFAFDDRCFDVLGDMHLENVVLLSVKDIMTEQLEQIQEERTRAEFCWTCTSLIIEHVLLICKEKVCTYIDADIYFFANPINAIQKIIDNNCSVGVVEHRFEKNYKYGKAIFRNGKYCVQFNTFVNDHEGRRVLKEWKENCLNWCYARHEDGRYGDQKYLDKWTQKYSCVYEAEDLGVGVAPWNLHLYKYVGSEEDAIWMKRGNKKFPVVFYHFEGMRYLESNKVYLNLWAFDKQGTNRKVNLLYGKYFETVEDIRKKLKKTYGITFSHMIDVKSPYLGRDYSFYQFCLNDGFFEGLRAWLGYWKNGVFVLDK